jgi:hypothetical protein
MVESTTFKLDENKNWTEIAIGIDLGGSFCYAGIYLDQ